MYRRLLSGLGGAAFLSSLCTVSCDEPEPRPQLLLHVDVDMALLAELQADQSPDAAVDTLRIEILTPNLDRIDARVFSLSSKSELPLSIGIPSEVTESGVVLVRLRAFRAAFAAPGAQDGAPVLDPAREVTVDRLLRVELPSSGVESAAVTLHGDCFGAPANFGLTRTCIDGQNVAADAAEGLSSAVPAVSSAGSWSRARVRDCMGQAPSGTVCIPGGIMALGDALFVARSELELDAAPIRLVELAPFFMDVTELTVGTLRGLVEDGYDGPLPRAGDQIEPRCTWLDSSDPELPLNCVEPEEADAICAARGGTVPSEAQWEHAARGRGERRLYPWGDTPPACCSASLERLGPSTCGPGELEPAGSHAGSADCPGDASRDGVLDLAGSLGELVRDGLSTSYDADCWQPSSGGILIDPVCDGGSTRVARGAGFFYSFGDAPTPIRRPFLELDAGTGFRCVFEGEP